MSLKARLDQLEERERRLLGVLVIVFAVFVVLLVPLGITALLGSQRSDNEELREAIQSIETSRALVAKMQAERQAVEQRYAQKAPALASFLAGLAKQSSIDIPESQDLDTIPHGNKYEERATKLVLRRVGMLALTKFMERIEQAPYPVKITRLNIRKRGTEQDSFDVEMIVSAYDRKVAEPKQRDEEEAAPEEEG